MESVRRLEKTEEPRTSEDTVVSHEESAQRGRVGVMMERQAETQLRWERAAGADAAI